MVLAYPPALPVYAAKLLRIDPFQEIVGWIVRINNATIDWAVVGTAAAAKSFIFFPYGQRRSLVVVRSTQYEVFWGKRPIMIMLVLWPQQDQVEYNKKTNPYY